MEINSSNIILSKLLIKSTFYFLIKIQFANIYGKNNFDRHTSIKLKILIVPLAHLYHLTFLL